MPKFHVNAMPNGMTYVQVDGHDLTGQVMALAFDSAPGQSPVLSLHMPVNGELEGEGIIQVIKPGNNVAEFLRQLDPLAIEQEALNSMQWGDGGSVGAAIMTLLIHLAEEAQDGTAESGASEEASREGLHGGHDPHNPEQLGLSLG